MINGYVRKDRLSEIKLVSGGLVMISLEQLEFLLKDLTGKSYDVFEIFTLIRGFDGDIINMDMMDTVVADCMYTLNTDGTNCKHVTLSPVAEEKETSRMIMEKEKLKIVLELLDQFLWRSIYGNKFDVGGTQMEDVKVYNSGPLVLKSYNLNIEDHTYLSSADSSFNNIFNKILKDKFNQKTRFEK